MKEISKKMKESSVLLIAAVIILSTAVITANTDDQSSEFMSASGDYILHPQQLQPQQTNAFDNWIHFDNGETVDALGLIFGGTFEFAIRLTPDELGDLAGYHIETVRYQHGYIVPFWMSGNIKIYEGGTSTQPGDVITTEPFEVTDVGWFDVELSEPVLIISGDEDIWVSIEATHQAGQYPAGFDNSSAVDGKGDWVYYDGVWDEIQNLGWDANFNIWAGIGSGNEPPDTPEQPDGPTEGLIGVEYTFLTRTNDPEEQQLYYLWNWDDETSIEWIGPYDSGATIYVNHTWVEEGEYEITVKAKDAYNESDWSDQLEIHILVDRPILEIGNITGNLFKVSAVIRNIGGIDANGVDWSIVLDDGLILLGKETFGRRSSIPAGEETMISSSVIIGFGKTMITVSAEKMGVSSDTKKVDAFMFLFFIKILE